MNACMYACIHILLLMFNRLHPSAHSHFLVLVWCVTLFDVDLVAWIGLDWIILDYIGLDWMF
jgi:hypothetical protein